MNMKTLKQSKMVLTKNVLGWFVSNNKQAGKVCLFWSQEHVDMILLQYFLVSK